MILMIYGKGYYLMSIREDCIHKKVCFSNGIHCTPVCFEYRQEWEQTCFPIILPSDSDYVEQHDTPRCSECRRPLIIYENGQFANFCHYCGARVIG